MLLFGARWKARRLWFSKSSDSVFAVQDFIWDQPEEMGSILISLGYHNKIHRLGGLNNKKIIFSKFQKLKE